MRKFLNLLLVIFMLSFIGVMSVDAAASSKIEKVNNKSYKYSWSGISDFDSQNYSYNLSCKNGTLKNIPGLSGNKINASEGYVELEPTITNGDIVCTIYKDDPASGNPTLTTASMTIGTTTTKPTEAPTTTKKEAPKSNNTNLKTLEVKTSDGSKVELTPTFKSDVYEYSANVSGTVKTISIDATLENSKATFIVSNNVNDELVAGENNKITITVTAEDGTKRTYTINITREALTADATLKELIIDEVEDFELIEDKYNYTIKIAKNVKELSLSYVTSDDNATAEIEGNENLKDGSKVRITVIAEDGTKKVYTLTVSKEKANTKTNTSNIETEKNPLIIMTLSIIAFGLIGGIVYVVKK